MLERAGAVWLPVDYVRRIGFVPPVRSETVRGQQYAAASNYPSAAVLFSPDRGHLDIRCGAECFDRTIVNARNAQAIELSPVTPGMFVNYDIYSQFGDGGDTHAGFAETGLFTSLGTGLTNLFCASGTDATCTRLESSWTIDNPGATTRLRLGDAISDAALWGAPVRFGGVRWGTDFSLNPDFLTFPTPSLSGDATLPGTVSVLINATERFQNDINPGPFTITDLPVVTGAGTAEAVVRDVLGRETLVTTQFYTAPQLLRSGLSDYSIEAGWLREAFGSRSNQYDAPFLAGGYAHGFADTLTVGVRSELSEELVSAGISAATSGVRFGVIEGSVAVSDSDGETGSRLELNHEYSSRALTLGTTVSYASEAFRQVGSHGPAPRMTTRAFLGWDVNSLGTASLNWIDQDQRRGDDYSAIGFGFTSRLQDASISLSTLKIRRPDQAFVASLTVSIPLGTRRTGSAGIDYRNAHVGSALRLRQSAPRAGGLGYNAEIQSNGIDRYQGGVMYRTAIGEVAADFSQVDGQEAGRLSARGGIAFLDSELALAQSITQSMAVVTVENEPGVRVYHDRQFAGTTDKHGKLVLTNVRAFEKNVLTFEPADICLAADMSTNEISVTPGYRTGHRIRFGVTHSSDILFHLVRSDGTPLPIGTRVTDDTAGISYAVGTDGRVFIPHAPSHISLSHTSGDQTCKAVIDPDQHTSKGPIKDLGRILCVAPAPEATT